MVSGLGVSAAHADDAVAVAPLMQLSTPQPSTPNLDNFGGADPFVVSTTDDGTFFGVTGTNGFFGGRFPDDGGFGLSGGATFGGSGVGFYSPFDHPGNPQITGIVSGPGGTVTVFLDTDTGYGKVDFEVPIGSHNDKPVVTLTGNTDSTGHTTVGVAGTF